MWTADVNVFSFVWHLTFTDLRTHHFIKWQPLERRRLALDVVLLVLSDADHHCGSAIVQPCKTNPMELACKSRRRSVCGDVWWAAPRDSLYLLQQKAYTEYCNGVEEGCNKMSLEDWCDQRVEACSLFLFWSINIIIIYNNGLFHSLGNQHRLK